jgi:hypothetical protein
VSLEFLINLILVEILEKKKKETWNQKNWKKKVCTTLEILRSNRKEGGGMGLGFRGI